MEFILKLQGYINEADVSQEQFLEQFIGWVESNGWGYTGKVSEVSEVSESEDITG